MRFIKTIYGTLSILLLFALISLVNITGMTWIMPTGIIMYVILTIVLIFLKGDSIMAKKKLKGKNEEKKPKEKKAKKVVGRGRNEPDNQEGNEPDVQVGNKSILPVDEGVESPFTMDDEADEETVVDDDSEEEVDEPEEKVDEGRGEGKLSKVISEMKALKIAEAEIKKQLEEKKKELVKVAGEL